MYRLNIDTILIDVGAADGKPVRFNCGDVLDGVPAGTLDSLVRLRQAVEFDQNAVVEIESPPANIDVTPAWDEARIDEIGLSKQTAKVFAAAGISTVREAIAFGVEHGSLQVMDGMTEAKEKTFQEAVEMLRPGSEGK